MRKRGQGIRHFVVGARSLALYLMPLWLACGASDAPAPPRATGGRAGAQHAASGPPAFRDVTKEVGIAFVHDNGLSGKFFMPEVVGPGAAVFDFDNDGDLDLYLVQGAPIAPANGVEIPRDRLYRNELTETGRLFFTDVTEGSGIDERGVGMGVAAGDYDNDGRVDLYVTNFGPNRLFRNRGDGTFEDVTAQSGTEDSRWNTSAAFVDYDRDGLLDLYVCAYVDFSLERHKDCYAGTSAIEYCGPLSYRPLPDRLFRNRGDGTFEDVTAVSQVARAYGGGLGVVCADFDSNGWIDIYVGNDGSANQLWLNRGDGTFRDDALLAGCALNADGAPEASMGIDAGDFDGDGDEDLILAHLSDETNTLYVNDGHGGFRDRSSASGLGLPSLAYTGFGCAWMDYDNDGWLDCFVANGAVRRANATNTGSDFAYGQGNQLFRNSGRGRFRETTAQAGRAFVEIEASRGAAFGDLDNDGDTDVVVANCHGPARVLLNEVGRDAHWVGLRLLDREGKRDLTGARVEARLDDGRVLWRRARADGSYCSANDPRVLLGFGTGKLHSIRVYWPDGRAEDFPPPPPGVYAELREAGGTEKSR